MSNPDVRFPPLESLTLSGYRFNEFSDGGIDWQYEEEGPWKERLRWPWRVLPESFVDWVGEYPIRYTWGGVKRWKWLDRRAPDGRTSLDCWLEVMDWSKLHSLNLRWPNVNKSTLAKLSGGAVPNLKNVTFVGGHSTAVLGFLANTSRPLESISLRNMDFTSLTPVADVISEHHSKEVKSLSIHQSGEEWTSSPSPPITLNTTEISTLYDSLTNLQYLSVDMDRTSTWNITIYSLLASSPSLTSLTLHYPSPDLNFSIYPWEFASQFRYQEDADDEIDPIVNQTSVLGLFRKLGEEKVGERLKRMEVVVGNWEDRFVQGGMVERLRRRVARYICEVGEDGGEVCEGEQTRNVSY
jgi:hypothetical protein